MKLDIKKIEEELKLMIKTTEDSLFAPVPTKNKLKKQWQTELALAKIALIFLNGIEL